MRPAPPAVLVAVLAAVPMTACAAFPEAPDYAGEASYQLAAFTGPDGATEVYELNLHPDGAAFLAVTREEQRSFCALGIRLREAEGGLLVYSVVPESAAARSRIAPDDLVLSVNGEPVQTLGAYNRVLDGLPAGRPVRIAVRGGDAPVTLDPESRLRTVRTRSRVDLETHTSEKPVLGIRLGTVPAATSRRIFGDDRNALVICGVASGSPAYFAGLRAGDMVERVDGKPAPQATELLRMAREATRRNRPLELEVVRDGGRGYLARVLPKSYSGVYSVHVPGFFHYTKRTRNMGWEALPWGLFAAYTNTYIAAKTREPQQSGSYSMLLGLVKFSWTPRGSRTRLLWFISFGT